ncbi:MAG: arginase family protein [Xanthomonadales bacterium]|nr:arginase family protein [Xanthomonadales bacterium]
MLDAPSNLGLRPPQPGVEPGVNRLPEAIRATGLPERLRVQDMGRVLPPAYSFVDEPTTGFRNGLAIAKYSRGLATRLSPILSSKRFVVVLGGDCSVLLGTGLALREKGRYGLVFIDAHDDFSPPRESFGYHGRLTAAGRDLGLATGFGPEQLVDIAGRKPYFRIDDVVQIGLSRTAKDGEFFAIEQFDHSGASVFDIDAIRRHGVHEIARKARHRLESAGTDGFWIHLDADVLDATVMPAVDSPNPRGMSLDQLQVILAELLASPKAVGMELTIFDPSLDPNGRLARQLANVIERAFVLSGRVRGFAATEDAMVHIPRNEAIFADALLAREPAPKVAGDNDIFAPLLGSWNLDVVFYNPDGSIKKRIPGEWHFARVLEGRAIADVWVVPPRADRKTIDPPPGEYGATLRFYDPHIHAWRSVWHGVVNGIVWSFIGRRIDDEIVLERIDEDGKLSHWVFYDMRADTFKWRSEVSSDGGKTWRLQQVMWAKRQPVGAT